MPIAPTYPGVYIQELPSGVHTITGVATSITAFVGRAAKGPTDSPVTILSFADYQRQFGGLANLSPMSFAVRDFFSNGGSQAIIVRLFHSEMQVASDVANAGAGAVTAAAVAASIAAAAAKYPNDPEKSIVALIAKAASDAAGKAGATAADVQKAASDEVNSSDVQKAAGASTTTFAQDGLNLQASSQGSWANGLQVRISGTTATSFNLSVRDSVTGETEVFPNLNVTPGDPREVGQVLTSQSQMLRLSGALPAHLPKSHADPVPPKGIWDNNNPATFSTATAPANDGTWLSISDFTGTGKYGAKAGLYALRNADLFNLLCIPPFLPDQTIDAGLIGQATSYCTARRAMLLIDPPPSSNWSSSAKAAGGIATDVGSPSANAALFFPRLLEANPLDQNQIEEFVPCGAVAGIFARTDSNRGVWKAPAGIDASLVGVSDLAVALTDSENGVLNPLGINCLRGFPAVGRVVWGARTRVGDDRLASQWKYIPVRRTALFLEESLYRGTQWVVFEPNDEPLWAQIRLNIGSFMQGLFRQGAFQGSKPSDAYFVKCDSETTTQNDIDKGIVNIVVGFAPLKPAEFVVIQLQQMAGQLEV